MQNNKTMTKEQKVALKVLALCLVFVGGILVGTTLTKTPQNAIQRVEVEKNAAEWARLKELDDEAITAGVKQTQLCGASLYTIQSGDSGTLKAIEEESKKNTEKFNYVVEARRQLLKKLGY